MLKPLYGQKHNNNGFPSEAYAIAIEAQKRFNPPVDSIITIIDMTKASTEKRLWVINTNNDSVLINTYVAHGKNSGDNYAVRFSNVPHSLMTSEGFYLTLNTYIGSHGYSLRLRGLEKDKNSNAEKRAIVMHGAWYVSEDFIKQYGRLGRSWGCPAVPDEEAKKIIDLIKNGSLLFIYTGKKD